jgi:hypothetical protein
MKRILFFNTAWMDRYQGNSNDKMQGGGKHIEKYGWGGEMFNFMPSGNNMYGYVQVGGKINLNRLGAKSSDDKVEDITIIWVAKEPFSGGNYIVGWYKNATVYRNVQRSTRNFNKNWEAQELGYYFVEANVTDTKLLTRDERTVQVPRGKGAMGQRNIWYAEKNLDYIEKVFKYVKTGTFPNSKNENKGTARQNDPLKRMKVERKAVKIVAKHYKKLGYEIYSVEKDNVGWDLNASNGKIQLKLEVKGLSGNDIATELTPNEYRHMNLDKGNYRICIVVETLISPKLMIFSYSIDNKKWTSQSGRVLKFEERISARIR